LRGKRLAGNVVLGQYVGPAAAPPIANSENAMNMVEANGARIPALGLGTMTLKDAVCVEAVKTALRLGYRNLDTAERYGNEAAVGEGLHQGLSAAGLKREDVFVTTKVYQDKLAAPDFERSVSESLDKLKLAFVDLLLIHWPNPNVPLAETIGALCKEKRAGRTRHIGVANFTTALLAQAHTLASEPLVTNQIEVHPFLDQGKVLAACRQLGMSVTAFCPIARGKVPGNEVLERIGKAHGKSPAQVSLRYLVQQGIIPIPRTANPDHLAANLAVFDFTLSEAEMAEIGRLKTPDGRVVNPPHAPKWD
jgi:2,5-diketo-D-gluconate reductase B